jgi:hypothetical protein
LVSAPVWAQDPQGAQDPKGAQDPTDARGPGKQAPAKEPDEEEDETEKIDPNRPYAVFQAGGAILALPAAELCPVSEDACEPAETALGFRLDSLARIQNFGFGAGITWAFGLRSTEVAGDPGLERELSRSYFLVVGQFRYYFAPVGEWEWWVGAAGGIVVIADSWTTLADREPYADTDFVGPKSLTLRTEGGAVGVGIGGHWRFYERLFLGTHLRYDNWILPSERERTPLGDLASFAGRIDVIDAGVALGYILPL